jgi:hypothetical protein
MLLLLPQLIPQHQLQYMPQHQHIPQHQFMLLLQFTDQPLLPTDQLLTDLLLTVLELLPKRAYFFISVIFMYDFCNKYYS